MNDHDILHFFFNTPGAASTSHALVKNGKYGISHAVAYEQDLLTPAQIKMMHDNWVEKHEPIGHTSAIDTNTEKQIEYKSRWDTVLINGERPVTKRDIFRYYADPSTKKLIFNQIKDTPVMMRQVMSPTEQWFKRNPKIDKNNSQASDATDLQYYIERRHIEFHPVIPDLTDRLVIDVDPGSKITLHQTKLVVVYLEKILENQSYIKDTEIQYSGNDGFYVWGILNTKMSVDALRETLKKLLFPITTMNGIPVTLKKNPGPKQVLLDLSPMKTMGTIKAEGSLDYRTGNISMKVPSSQLETFEPKKDASIFTKDLKPAYSFKDEELI